MDQGRETKRYASEQELRVRCETWGEFVSLYAADVSQGGMFILTSEPPPAFSEIEVALRLPEGHEIRLQARVVHVLDPEQAAATQRRPGVGVEFLSLDAMQKAQIHQLVEFARWQGTSHRPTATLASHMFELNAPTAPAQSLPASSGPPAPRLTKAPAHEDFGRDAGQGAAPDAEPEAPRKRKRRRQSSGQIPAQHAADPPPPPPPKPTDLERLKIGMTHLARKRFEEAIATFRKMLDDNPGDPEAGKWLHVSYARLAISRNDEKTAETSYQLAIEIDEENAEARKFLRELAHVRKLNALPFGRYFVKKRPTDP